MSVISDIGLDCRIVDETSRFKELKQSVRRQSKLNGTPIQMLARRAQQPRAACLYYDRPDTPDCHVSRSVSPLFLSSDPTCFPAQRLIAFFQLSSRSLKQKYMKTSRYYVGLLITRLTFRLIKLLIISDIPVEKVPGGLDLYLHRSSLDFCQSVQANVLLH